MIAWAQGAKCGNLVLEMLPTLKDGFPETGLLALRLTIAHF